jgi:hypothetical protein
MQTRLTPEEEIDRIKMDNAECWTQLEQIPAVQRALAENDPVKLAEIVYIEVKGNRIPKSSAPPKYALVGAQTIIKNGNQEHWKMEFKNLGVVHGNFQSSNPAENLRVLALACAEYSRALKRNLRFK